MQPNNVTAVSNGAVTLSAATANACGNVSELISVGGPAAPTSITTITTPQDIDMFVDGGSMPQNVSSYNWYVNNVLVSGQHSSEYDLLVKCGINYSISVQAVNGCGTSPKLTKLENAPCGFPNVYAISPNPATGMVNVSTASGQAQSNAKSATAPQSKIYQIKVLGQSGNVLKAFSYSSGVNTAHINLSGLMNGTYTLQIYDNVSWTSQQVVIMK